VQAARFARMHVASRHVADVGATISAQPEASPPDAKRPEDS
jgi:hypothetical protein